MCANKQCGNCDMSSIGSRSYNSIEELKEIMNKENAIELKASSVKFPSVSSLV